ncbi:MAG: histidinol-phosphatase [Candidatus Latescibacteria bacterium]|nr:histidinol-phosphatase [Candidatus Latescibacterota bacterium]NIO54711.1 histidinol-phosphatase [Candidatus Latescibacterota bacterium]
MKMDPLRWLNFLEEIADRADGIALQFFRSHELRVEDKTDMTPVTDADRAIEDMARGFTREKHAGLGICGEEQGETPASSDSRLIIDPIDGTRNFVRGIPIFATLLAIVQRDEVIAGLISAPALGMRWRAARGYGAYCKQRRIKVAGIQNLSHAQLFHGELGGTAEIRPPEGFQALMNMAKRTRGFGDFYQHALVAEGAGELAIDPVVRPWDIAAVQVIVEEAGGKATTLTGERTIYGGSLVTSNGHVHEESLRIVNRGI